MREGGDDAGQHRLHVPGHLDPAVLLTLVTLVNFWRVLKASPRPACQRRTKSSQPSAARSKSTSRVLLRSRSQRKKMEIVISRFRDFDRRSSAPRVEMGNMCTFGRVRKPHGHVQADARSTRMGANRAGASAGRGGQAAAVERAGSVSASAGRGERTSAGGGGGARRLGLIRRLGRSR